MPKKLSLYKSIKTARGWRYCKAAFHPNAKVKPNIVIVDGQEGRHSEGALFLPNHTASRVRRILLGWSATREAIRAVVDSLPLLVRAEAVEVLTVDEERQRERHGQKPGTDIVRRLPALGAQVEVQRLSS